MSAAALLQIPTHFDCLTNFPTWGPVVWTRFCIAMSLWDEMFMKLPGGLNLTFLSLAWYMCTCIQVFSSAPDADADFNALFLLLLCRTLIVDSGLLTPSSCLGLGPLGRWLLRVRKIWNAKHLLSLYEYFTNSQNTTNVPLNGHLQQ